MSVTVTGKLNKSANKRASDKGGAVFLVNIGKQEYNRATQQKEWVNYSAALYAKDAQEAFYDKALQQGAIVSVSGTGILPTVWGDNNQIQLGIVDSKLEYVGFPSEKVTETYQQAPQQAPQQQAPVNNDPFFDDDLPPF